MKCVSLILYNSLPPYPKFPHQRRGYSWCHSSTYRLCNRWYFNESRIFGCTDYVECYLSWWEAVEWWKVEGCEFCVRHTIIMPQVLVKIVTWTVLYIIEVARFCCRLAAILIRTACTDMRYERDILLKSPLRVLCQCLYKSNIGYKDVFQNTQGFFKYLVIQRGYASYWNKIIPR